MILAVYVCIFTRKVHITNAYPVAVPPNRLGAAVLVVRPPNRPVAAGAAVAVPPNREGVAGAAAGFDKLLNSPPEDSDRFIHIRHHSSSVQMINCHIHFNIQINKLETL